MQNKGFVKVITVLLALICIYYLSFSVISHHYESQAEAYANGDNAKYNAFLDSVAKEKPMNGWFFGYTVKECREQELSLGLDLKGGMNVVMEVSVPDILCSLAGEKSKDANFQKSIAEANKAQESSQDSYLNLFIKALKQNAEGQKLAYYFSSRNTQDQIKSNATDEEVVKVLEKDVDVAIENSFNVLRSRIDRFGVIQPNIQRLAGSSRVLIEMPGIKEPERVRKLLQGSANLEFWKTVEFSEVANDVVALNEALKQEAAGQKPAVKAEKKEVAKADTAKADTAKASDDDLLASLDKQDTTKAATAENAEENKGNDVNPLFSIFQLSITKEGRPLPGPRIGFAQAKDTAKVSAYFREGIKKGIIKGVVPRWTVKSEFDEDQDLFSLIALEGSNNPNQEAEPALTGDVVTDANEDFEKGQVYASVSMEMNAEGAREWSKVTEESKDKCIAIVLDGYVYSYPRVHNRIDGGRSSITGNFTPEEANDLANVLKSGKMPAPAKIVQEDIVGPSLGQEAIRNGFISFAVAFVMILIYMMFYYGFIPGLVADIALLANVFIIFGVLASYKAVLTLPGIAGIVLTLGMAVDANVLIYERTREELKKGKDILSAMGDGYSNALSAIIDSNITTVLTGIILFAFGTGPIRGFATTLIIGILSSMFTAVLLSRLIFDRIMKNEKYHNLKFTTDITKNWLQDIHFDFIGKSKTFITISILVILAGIASLCFHGLKSGIDFTGGRNYVVRFEQDKVSTEEIKGLLDKQFDGQDGSVSVINIGAPNQVRISTNYRIKDNADDVDADIESKMYNALKPVLGQNVTEDMFITRYVVENNVARKANISDNSTFGIQSSAKVGPTMAFDIIRNAIIAVIFALLGIGTYILIRFRDVAFSVASIVTLAHDTMVIIGIFSLCYSFMPFSMEVDQQFIAALLTVIGYSINDNVVIFDRIREYREINSKRDQHSVFNDALASTMSRTFSTSMSTLVVLIIIFFFGGEVIRGFIFAMLIGVIVGTYSSVFIASPVAYAFLNKKYKKEVNDEVVEAAK